MTRFAFGAKCSSGRAPWVFLESGAPANRSRFRSEARAITPIPVVDRPRNWRRVEPRAISSKSSTGSPPGDGLVEVQEHVADRRPGGQLGGVESGGPRRLALPAPGFGRLPGGPEVTELPAV